MTVEEIVEHAGTLSDDDRARIAALLLESLEPPGLAIAPGGWIDIARERVRQVLSGEVQVVPGEQVLAELREHIEQG